jgi:hypothetical protein
LNVGVFPQGKSFARHAKKCRGAGFGSDDGSQHRPPRNATAAEREIMQAFFLPAHAQADGDDNEEIEEKNEAIDPEPSVHAFLGDRESGERKHDFL